MNGINLWAVLLAAVSSFFLGGLWYSKLMFLGPWSRAAGPLPHQTEQKHPARVFGVSFLFALLAAVAFAFWLGPQPPLGAALRQGLIAGFCFVAASFGVNYQFANRSPLLWLIDGGYHTAQFLLFGLVLGLWH
ncbi:DUF1761 domain-containing protein [Aggregicoccus sp. 17bor-14]|uniref:DUF1761 domain-containing protein n=1 Tax=Myxococcaceae TaxID=31 RepID=UPI00129C73DA|nr:MULTISPECIES: DUF1761 domain-containing protein [Myxococcaceae]MBF5041627.1 DUF1761 domain-containing protein [Simulacricoccus sp. 17bor-14]MRI87412.1 DUF1761 domain-containing protein [Aggregicoccus sp. 17bor-14]